MKSKAFQGLMFAKFKSTTDRDIAVALLRSAELTEAGNRVWATQDLPLEKRTRKTFLLGLKWQLGEWGFMKREIEIDDDYSQLKVGHRGYAHAMQLGRCMGAMGGSADKRGTQAALRPCKQLLTEDGWGQGSWQKQIGSGRGHFIGTAPFGSNSFTNTVAHFRSHACLQVDKPTIDAIQAQTHLWVFFSKNARLHTSNRLAEMLSELSTCDWDVVLFSETRRAHGDCKLQDGYRLYLYTTQQHAGSASVAVLLHAHHVQHVRKVSAIGNRIIHVDVNVDGIHRFIACYMPHAGYPHADLCDVYEPFVGS